MLFDMFSIRNARKMSALNPFRARKTTGNICPSSATMLLDRIAASFTLLGDRFLYDRFNWLRRQGKQYLSPAACFARSTGGATGALKQS